MIFRVEFRKHAMHTLHNKQTQPFACFSFFLSFCFLGSRETTTVYSSSSFSFPSSLCRLFPFPVCAHPPYSVTILFAFACLLGLSLSLSVFGATPPGKIVDIKWGRCSSPAPVFDGLHCSPNKSPFVCFLFFAFSKHTQVAAPKHHASSCAFIQRFSQSRQSKAWPNRLVSCEECALVLSIGERESPSKQAKAKRIVTE